MQSICSIGIQHTKWCIQSLFVAVQSNETRLFSVCLTFRRETFDGERDLLLGVYFANAATLESVARFLNSAMICDLFWSGTQRRKWRIQSIWKRYRHSSSSHTTRTLEKDAPSSRDDLFSRSKCLLRIAKGVGLAKVWTRGNNESEHRQREHRDNIRQRRLRLIPTGTKMMKMITRSDDDSDDDDGRGRRRQRQQPEEKKVFETRFKQRRSRVPTREEEEEVLLLRASQRTNFQSAGSFWSR